MGMTMEAQEARKNYWRQYRSQNRERINAQRRAWGPGTGIRLRSTSRSTGSGKRQRETSVCHGQHMASQRSGIRSCWRRPGLGSMTRKSYLLRSRLTGCPLGISSCQ